jgi:hypothetical protein
MHVFAPDRIAASRIGLFWFIAKDRNPARFAGVSRKWSSVPTVAGKKVLDQDHANVWPIVQKLDHHLQRYPYDYFPRGRLIWLEDGDRWQLKARHSRTRLELGRTGRPLAGRPRCTTGCGKVASWMTASGSFRWRCRFLG